MSPITFREYKIFRYVSPPPPQSPSQNGGNENSLHFQDLTGKETGALVISESSTPCRRQFPELISQNPDVIIT
jgi:hypothetical protein